MSALITRMYTSILDVFLIFTRLIIFFFFFFFFFFFNDTATTEIYTLSLHDALPIFALPAQFLRGSYPPLVTPFRGDRVDRSEEHTSELQSHHDLVCRLLLEKKKKKKK